MARCTVTQPDSHTIRVDADGGSLRIPYRFFWDGHEREPESVVLEETKGRREVRAFFLFGTIEDTVGCDAHGITIDRTWSVKSIGTVRLTLDLEFDLPEPAAVLFPGVAAIGAADAWCTFPGDRTSYPLSAFVRGGRTEALVWSEHPAIRGERASIGACRVAREDEPLSVWVQVRAPGIGEPITRVGPRPGDVEQPVDGVIQAQGDLVVSHRVCVAFSRTGGIQTRGAVCVLARSAAAAAAGSPAEEAAERPAVDRERLREAFSACLSTHLYQVGGVAGLRESPGSPRLSASAGLGAAVLARRLFPGDERMEELARRLADFALKGQHPAGLFFTAYDERAGEWTGVRGKPKNLLLSAADAARSADSLLALAGDLAADGLPYEKYWLAGLRFVEFFIDPKARLCLPGSLHAPDERTPAEPGISGMGLFSPLARVYGRTRRDRHRKPLDELARRFSAAAWNAFDPPSLRGERGADAEASLLAARLFVEMRQMGYRPAEPTGGTPSVQKKRAAEATMLFAALLVPWIRVHTDGSGMLADSFACQRLVPAGYETAWLLLGLREESKDADLSALLRRLAQQCLEGARRLPIGISWLQHTNWDAGGRPAGGRPAEARGAAGPVDARRLAREVWFGLRLLEDFPRL